MGIEIDFLAVGDHSKSGDAIAVRYGNLHGSRTEQQVVVIDGGYSDSGKSLVELIRTQYNTDDVDLVISTHPDQDHVCGLEVVVEELNVGELWMHQPWNHSVEMNAARRYGFNKARFSERVEKALEGASELESIARRRGIPIREPFTGVISTDGLITVVGPTEAYYEELLAAISPTIAASLSVSALLRKAIGAFANLVPETLWLETLSDNGVTQPQNNTSAITLLQVDSKLHLFTGDAGIPAMEGALDTLEARGFAPGMLDFVQVPALEEHRNEKSR